jgi:hypothetical protein
MPYTTPAEVRKRALIKWDSLNYDQGAPFADEAALDSWLSDTIIPQVEKIINDFCFRVDFGQHTGEVEVSNGDGFRSFIMARQRPIIAVSKLEFKKGDGTWDLKSASDYYVKGNQILYRTVIPRGFQNIRVTYDWGFSTIPAEVTYCAAEMVARFLQKRVVNKMGPLVRVGDYRVELANPDVFTSDLKLILIEYEVDAMSIQ